LTIGGFSGKVLQMQIRLNKQAEALILKYIEIAQDVFKGYNVKPTQIVNGMFIEQVSREIRRYQKKKP
jgi:hypothetical protein